MDNLNKETFFNVAGTLYPTGMLIFDKWLDQYKADNNWNELFNAKFTFIKVNDFEQKEDRVSPEFIDLPFEFQYGIIMRFVSEQIPSVGDDLFLPINDIKTLFMEYLEWAGKENKQQ